MLKDLKEAIDTVVAYSWSSEMTDYQNCEDGQGGNQRAGHIFETLVFLDNFVNGTNFRPSDYLPAEGSRMLTVQARIQVPADRATEDMVGEIEDMLHDADWVIGVDKVSGE